MLVVVAVLLVLCLLMLLALASIIKRLKDQVESMEGQVLRLSEQVQQQEKALEAMQEFEEEAPPGPGSSIVPLVGSLFGSNRKQAIPGLLLIAFQLIAAYLRRRAEREPEN